MPNALAWQARCRNRKRSDPRLIRRSRQVQSVTRLRSLGLPRPIAHELDPKQQADRQRAQKYKAYDTFKQCVGHCRDHHNDVQPANRYYIHVEYIMGSAFVQIWMILAHRCPANC